MRKIIIIILLAVLLVIMLGAIATTGSQVEKKEPAPARVDTIYTGESTCEGQVKILRVNDHLQNKSFYVITYNTRICVVDGK